MLARFLRHSIYNQVKFTEYRNRKHYTSSSSASTSSANITGLLYARSNSSLVSCALRSPCRNGCCNQQHHFFQVTYFTAKWLYIEVEMKWLSDVFKLCPHDHTTMIIFYMMLHTHFLPLHTFFPVQYICIDMCNTLYLLSAENNCHMK